MIKLINLQHFMTKSLIYSKEHKGNWLDTSISYVCITLHDKLTMQVEFASGALRCGEYITLRKVGDTTQKASISSSSYPSFFH